MVLFNDVSIQSESLLVHLLHAVDCTKATIAMLLCLKSAETNLSAAAWL